MDCGELALLKKIFYHLRIQEWSLCTTPFGFAQQFETQQSLPEKFFYFESCWRCNFTLAVEATSRVLQKEWLRVKSRLYSAHLLQQVRRSVSMSTLPASKGTVFSSSRDIMVGPVENFPGILGHLHLRSNGPD